MSWQSQEMDALMCARFYLFIYLFINIKVTEGSCRQRKKGKTEINKFFPQDHKLLYEHKGQL